MSESVVACKLCCADGPVEFLEHRENNAFDVVKHLTLSEHERTKRGFGSVELALGSCILILQGAAALLQQSLGSFVPLLSPQILAADLRYLPLEGCQGLTALLSLRLFSLQVNIHCSALDACLMCPYLRLMCLYLCSCCTI